MSYLCELVLIIVVPGSVRSCRSSSALPRTPASLLINCLSPIQYRNKFLPKDIRIVGYARTKMDRTEFLKRVRSYIKVPTKEIEEQLASFCDLCTYIAGQYDEDEPFVKLNKHLEEFEKGKKEQNRIFYMALPPSVFTTVSEHLKKNCYPKNGIARIIVSCVVLTTFH